MKTHPPAAAAALTCGILSLCSALVPPVGIALGIAALVLAARAQQATAQQPEVYAVTGMPTAARICAIIGLLVAGVLLLAWLSLASLLIR
nr:hypothetical protein [Planctomycetota bacterium]